jgi:IPT/TIG domain
MSNYNVFFPERGNAIVITKPRAGEQPDPNVDGVQEGGGNTGTYNGYAIRVKGDGRVEAIDPSGHATMHSSTLNARHWIDNQEPVELPPQAPVIDSITPSSTPVDTPVQVTLTGSGFAADSTVEVDGNDILSAYVSDTEMTADFPGAFTPGDVEVTVTTEGIVSAPITFSVTAAEE